MTPWLFSPNNSAFLYLISFASSESKCVLPLVCLYLRHIVTQMHVFLPFSEPIFIFIGIYTVKCMRKLRTPRAFHLQTAAPHQPPLVFYLSVFFSPEGQYEIIRHPSMLTSVWIYSWCSLEMPGNKSLLSHRLVALVPVHFSSPPAEREERQGRENERTRCPRRWNELASTACWLRCGAAGADASYYFDFS